MNRGLRMKRRRFGVFFCVFVICGSAKKKVRNRIEKPWLFIYDENERKRLYSLA